MEWIKGAKPTILHPTDGLVEFRLRDYQEETLRAWRERARLIVKSRQLGFSQTFGAEAYWKARFRGPRRILAVSRKLEAAMEFVSYVRGFCKSGDLAYGGDSKTALTFANGSRLKAEAATRSAGRSFAASDVYLDEMAHAPWALAIWQAVRPTIATGGSITTFSSPKGRANILFQLWSGGLGQKEWWRRRYTWEAMRPYGWNDAWAARERAQMTRQQFAEEYEADFIESGGTLFAQVDIDACYQAIGLSEEPIHDRLFTADVAGPGEDATVCHVWDLTRRPYRLVAHERWVEGPYERFYQTGARMVKQWGCRDVWIDATGLGNPMVEEFSARLGREVMGFTFTKKTKEAALTALQLLTQQHAYQHQEPQLKTEMELYQREDSELVTDEVMAAAIMAYAVSERPGQGIW